MSTSSRDAYVAKVKSQLDELNATIDELQAKAKDARHDARVRYDAEMTKLQEQSAAARARLDELKAAGEDNWRSMVAGMDKVREAFVHSFHYFKSQL
jgi:peptidoglycan hydrolase CwlO-like protein